MVSRLVPNNIPTVQTVVALVVVVPLIDTRPYVRVAFLRAVVNERQALEVAPAV